MSQFADRIRETTKTTGTGTISLDGAAGGNYRTFVAGIGSGKAAIYTIRHWNGTEWEVGLGVVTDATPDTLSRLTVLSSSNANALVNFTAGTKDVFVSVTAFHMTSLSQIPRRVRVASTENVDISLLYNGNYVIDGVSVATGDRVFLKNQSTASQNGIYTVNASGSATRAPDYYTGDGAAGTIIVVEAGTANADSVYLCTSNSGSDVVGTNNLAFIRITGPRIAAIAELAPTDSNIIVGDGTTWVAESGNTARTSLGLGTGDIPQFANLGIGTAGSAPYAIRATKTLSGATIPQGLLFQMTASSGSTGGARGVNVDFATEAASFTCPLMIFYETNNPTVGAGSTLTAAYGFRAVNMTTPGTVIGFVSEVSSGANKWSFYGSGSANNLMNGPVILGSSAAPTLAADQAAVHAIDAAAGNRCVGWKTENGQVGKLYTVNSGSAYSPTNVTTDRSFDADATTTAELADVLGTLIADLKLTGLIA